MHRHDPERMAEKGANRFERLYRFLNSGKLEVKVLPDSAFGLVHGKAGVIEMADGRCTSFLGSANESKTAWRRNFELVWEDEDPESIQWVRDEFDALWGNKPVLIIAPKPLLWQWQDEMDKLLGMPSAVWRWFHRDFSVLTPMRRSK